MGGLRIIESTHFASRELPPDQWPLRPSFCNCLRREGQRGAALVPAISVPPAEKTNCLVGWSGTPRSVWEVEVLRLAVREQRTDSLTRTGTDPKKGRLALSRLMSGLKAPGVAQKENLQPRVDRNKRAASGALRTACYQRLVARSGLLASRPAGAATACFRNDLWLLRLLASAGRIFDEGGFAYFANGAGTRKASFHLLSLAAQSQRRCRDARPGVD